MLFEVPDSNVQLCVTVGEETRGGGVEAVEFGWFSMFTSDTVSYCVHCSKET